MLDFTSSLYLGFHHPSHALEPWLQLTTGKPAALGVPSRTTTIAKALAELQGCERATLLPSTLHLFFDLFAVLRRDGIRLYVDAGAYPMLRWGAERAAARGVPMRRFLHHDTAAAHRQIAEDESSGLGFSRDAGPDQLVLHGYAAERFHLYERSITRRPGWNHHLSRVRRGGLQLLPV
jgi:hypothetical protein